MKKFLFLLLAVSFAACDKATVTEDMPSVSYSSKTALVVSEYGVDSIDVSNYLSMFYPKLCVKSVELCKVSSDIKVYVVELENGGWMMMSSDIRLTPLLAFSGEGSIDAGNTYNHGFVLWIKRIHDKLLVDDYLESEECKSNIIHWRRSMIGKKVENPKSVPGEIWAKRMLSHRVDSTGYLRGPLTLTKWGQSEPWNSSLPNNFYTGCVAVALSQILYFNNHFYNIPNALYHNITVNTSGPLYDLYIGEYKNIIVQRSGYTPYSIRWGQMKLELSSSGNAGYVADLMADVGERTNTRYSDNGSFSSLEWAYDALGEYSLQGEISGYTYNLVKAEIDNNRVVYMSGEYEDDAQTHGHSWVLDGYREVNTTHTYEYMWLVDGNQYEGELYTRDQVQALFPGERLEDGMISYEYEYIRNRYVHMNWGWDGVNNGFYYETPGIDYPYHNRISLIKGIRSQD